MSFADAYTAIRAAEGRNYSDALLRNLPDISSRHPLSREWRQRKASLERLMGYLRSQDRPLRILDLGCGIGWMSHHLSWLPDAEVIAVERVAAEMDQAREVFANRPTLLFREADVFKDDLGMFDTVVLGASVQYFPALEPLVGRLRAILNPGGEIHIFDSPFYRADQLGRARERSASYYARMGFPELAAHYFHHAEEEVERLGGHRMYDPGTFWHRLGHKLTGQLDSPFPWIRFLAT